MEKHYRRTNKTVCKTIINVIVGIYPQNTQEDKGVTMKTHDCGSCKHFQKVKNWGHPSGICNLNDYRTNSDYGHGCSDWKAIPYKGRKKYQEEV